MKLKIRDKFGNGLKLKDSKDILIHLPYLGVKYLERSLAKSQIKLLNGDGEIEVILSDFDKQGLNTGTNQSFSGKIFIGDSIISVSFKGLNVHETDGKKHIGDIDETKGI